MSSFLNAVGRATLHVSLCVMFVGAQLPCAALAEEAGSHGFFLNQDMIAHVRTAADEDACQPPKVLPALLKQIGPVATVFPTENYFYFGFYSGGKSYSGSLRLAVDTRDAGIVQYVCNETYTGWSDVDLKSGVQKDLGQKDGVSVKKVEDLQYQVGYGDTSVRFALNKLDQSPNKDVVGPDEDFVGRSFDESGCVFDLLYNRKVKAFYFVLDEKYEVPEAFIEVDESTLLGKRTGFAFYRDVDPVRLVLIAVNSEEVYKNTPYDGPFDQLPENFYKQIDFWKYVFDAEPDLAGKYSPGGTSLTEDLIFGLSPYREYTSKDDLIHADTCAERKAKGSTEMILCMTGQARQPAGAAEAARP